MLLSKGDWSQWDLAFCEEQHSIFPLVAKLDIAADSDSEGRGFESLRAGH